MRRLGLVGYMLKMFAVPACFSFVTGPASVLCEFNLKDSKNMNSNDGLHHCNQLQRHVVAKFLDDQAL